VTGLRRYERDRELPAIGGDEALVPPTASEVSALVEEHLLGESLVTVASVTWEYARWKPGVSTTAVHSVRLSDGTERLVTIKCYADGKAAQLDQRWSTDARLFELCAPLRPAAILPAQSLALSCFPADRKLGGVPRLLDPRRTARTLEECGWCEERSIRKRRLAFELLRFKPEHRAVYAMHVDLRSPDGTKSARKLAARVLPPDAVRRIVAARERLQSRFAFDLAPELIASDSAAGLLYEAWLELEVFDPSALASFAESFDAGELLGQLHSCRPEQFSGRQLVENRARVDLFRFDPELAERVALHHPRRSSASPVWRHGDFHPDQLGREHDGGRLRLLDLDELSVGDPADDLASWIADRLALDPSCEFADAAGELLEGYRRTGGERLSHSEIELATANALVDLAAGALRRLEVGAVEKSRRLIAFADQLVESHQESGCSS